MISLSATVTSSAGIVNEGTETFTILSGTTPVGSAATANVSNGAATASYTLPGDTPAGTYTIEAVYNGTADYATSTDTSHSLTIVAPLTITWNTATAPTGGDWDTPDNWVGGVVPTAFDNAIINLTSSGTVTHSTGANDAVLSLTTNGNTVLSIGSGSIALGDGSSTLASVTIGTGASLSVAAGASVLIQGGQTITDNGAMNITDASIGFVAGYSATTQILVNGTLSSTDSNFYISGGNYASFALLQVDSGGELTASTTTFDLNELNWVNGSIMNTGDVTNDTFNLPIYVPFQDVTLLSNNQSFQNINIIAGTMASGQTLSLVPIGTVSTASLVYIVQGNFTVGTGATLSVGTGTNVLIDPVTITDNGAMNVTDASIGFVAGYSATTQILVNGTLSASGSNFYISGGNYASFALLQVDSGGELTASTTTFDLNELNWVNGSIMNTGDVTNDTFNSPIYVPFQDVALLANNQSFQDINIIAGTMASGQTLSLVPIGTVSTASLVYIVQGNFTVGTGATLSVGTGTNVLIDPVTITDDGAMNVTDASIGFVAGYSATTQILVNGTLSSSGSNFYISGGNYASFALLQVDSGGELTASTTTFDLNELNWVNGSIMNTGDVTNDTFNLPIYVPFQDVTLLSNNQSFQNINIIAGTMASGQTLSLVPIGTVSTASLVYIVQGNFTVGTGATLTVGTGTSVLIDPVTITDNGAMNITDASIGFVAGYSATTQILVNGTLSASGSNFYISGGNYASFALLQVDSGGELTASTTTFDLNELNWVNGSITNTGDVTNDTFNSPIYMPFQDVALLANNASFQDINIIAGTMASGQTLSLVPIGTVSTASLVYIVQGNFTVGTGATLTVGTGTSVLIDPVTITDDGAMNVTDASIGFVAGYSATTQILVNGTLSASGSNFYISGGNYASFALLQVDSGGELTATSSTFSVNQLVVQSGSTANLQFVTFATQLAVNSGASLNIHDDDLSSANATVVASGGSTTTIDLTNNFWGTLNTTQIAAKITDHSNNSNLPTVLYQPFLSENATGTYAADASIIYNANSQTVTLSATVISGDGPVTGGTETFTIQSGSNVIGTPVTSNVANGAASGTYTIPAGTLGGVYTIQAVFSGTSTLSRSSDSTHTLTITEAATTTTASSATTTFSTSNQTISLSATVTSSAGIVNEGTETFTLLSGTTTVGTPATANLSNGAVTASYTLPGGTTAGNYTIEAVYNGTADYATSTDTTHSLTIIAPLTITWNTATAPTGGAGTRPATGWVAWSRPRSTM